MTNASDTPADMQYAVLEAAYEAGYFEHPRRTPGTDVAASLGLDSATFQRRLQGALATCAEECLVERSSSDG